MARIMNVNAEDGANIIDDGTDPVLKLTNSSANGTGLETNRLVSVSGATLAGAQLVDGNKAVATAVGTTALTVQRTVVGNSSTAVMVLLASGASVPILGLAANAFVSAVSIIFAASGNWAGMGGIRVLLSDGITYGWIPIIPSASFTAAAI